MSITKGAIKKDNYYFNELFYDRARDAMFDLLSNMKKASLIDTVLLPGYIGWSPNEGSGIFDPINDIDGGIEIKYYKMTNDLQINKEDLISKINSNKTAVLIVNYFGFRDRNIQEIIPEIKSRRAWIIEDNAHGFFTYHMNDKIESDATFFSLHKMFPFEKGGSLVLLNDDLKKYNYSGKNIKKTEFNPYTYDIQSIASLRISNFKKLYNIIMQKKVIEYFEPLKTIDDLNYNVPQTFPIIIKNGDRNQIYQMMNNNGFGVVSLYHTLIKDLQLEEFNESLCLSKRIMNLPVHQDVCSDEYSKMIDLLIECCNSCKGEIQ